MLIDSPRDPSPVPGADVFRPVQYLGSKARLLDAIQNAVDEVDASRGPMLDLFSGSGVVAAQLARTRAVTAVDIQEYARVLASALLAPARLTPLAARRLEMEADNLFAELAETAIAPVLRCEDSAAQALDRGDPEALCQIVEDGSLAAFQLGQGPSEGSLASALDAASSGLDNCGTALTITRYYGGVYYSYAQALRIDCLLEVARSFSAEEQRDTLLAAVLGAASDCVTSVGNHFAQPVRPRDKHRNPKTSALRAVVRRRERKIAAIFADRLERYRRTPGAAHQATAVRSDYRSFLEAHRVPVAVAYADPPYTRDHYSRFYHVLETMARGDEPEISMVTTGGGVSLSRGLYRRERHQSPFCIRSEAKDAFRSLFSRVRLLEAPLVLSYSRYISGTAARPQPRLLTIPQVVEVAAETFSEVRIRSAGQLRHSKFNANHLNGGIDQEPELLLICLP
jgi:adenine-specific DNA-methyltransferase